MNLKKYLVGFTLPLMVTASFAQPNDITITGLIINGTMSESLTTEIYTNATDSNFVTIDNGTYSPNSQFQLSNNQMIPYSLLYSSLGNPVKIDMYDSTCNYTCEWTYYLDGDDPFPHLILTKGNLSYCHMDSISNLIMEKECNN